MQLDIYGELFDSIYLAEQQALRGHGELLGYDDWMNLTPLIDWVCKHWQEPDDGMGDTRWAQALHPLAFDVLGRDRPRDENRDQPWSTRGPHPLDRGTQ